MLITSVEYVVLLVDLHEIHQPVADCNKEGNDPDRPVYLEADRGGLASHAAVDILSG